ncbi:hypothetical protein [Methylobrevis albus]|uniref:Uncharacterized protein n=1 Tax=Methylobrevis albus TaxID=2793297 RepID=A0A931MZI4_9HYPH|nr:hypothetical protein [Methylobrevis albus]MBH0239050.1 hypothetical protein [Methylobrevis albus]
MDSAASINWAEIIKASSSPLGLAALTILALAIVALTFFRGERDWRVRMVAFVLLLVGFGGFAAAINLEAAEEKEKRAREEVAVVPPPVPDLCEGIDITMTPHNAIGHAWWCGTGGATRTPAQQAVRDRTPSCIAYAQRPFANLSQNQLWAEARSLAKQGRDDEAIELIDACQCHNPTSQALIQEGRLKVICYLKKN